MEVGEEGKKVSKTPKEEMKIYCKKCGSTLDEEKKCTGCGKQYFSLKRIFKKTKSILFVFSLIGNVLLVVYGYSTNEKYMQEKEAFSAQSKKVTELSQEKSDLGKKVTELKVQIKRLEESGRTKQIKISQLTSATNFFDEHAGIVTVGGSVYHKYDCHHWKDSDIYIYNTELAEYKGYRACYDCH